MVCLLLKQPESECRGCVKKTSTFLNINKTHTALLVINGPDMIKLGNQRTWNVYTKRHVLNEENITDNN